MPRETLAGEVGKTLGGYIVAQVKIAALLSCLYAIGYAISGVPFWLFFGLLCGLLNLIPIVGSLIGLAFTAFAVLVKGGGLWNYAGILITFVIVQGLEGFWLSPRVLGKGVGLSPLYVFLAVLLGGAMFGPIGLLLAVPVLAVIGVLWRHAVKRRTTA
ncbi:MAG TPA: AI-2E family transporter [Bryobacteraceae bacterium]|nr:AI-2E family transporter [Bryobacteraceae bacterium]